MAGRCGRGRAAARGGNKQYVNKCPMGSFGSDDANQMMLLSDMVLAWDADFRKVLDEYAADEERLAVDFSAAFKKDGARL